jgi:hypothetical protein
MLRRFIRFHEFADDSRPFSHFDASFDARVAVFLGCSVEFAAATPARINGVEQPTVGGNSSSFRGIGTHRLSTTLGLSRLLCC